MPRPAGTAIASTAPAAIRRTGMTSTSARDTCAWAISPRFRTVPVRSRPLMSIVVADGVRFVKQSARATMTDERQAPDARYVRGRFRIDRTQRPSRPGGAATTAGPRTSSPGSPAPRTSSRSPCCTSAGAATRSANTAGPSVRSSAFVRRRPGSAAGRLFLGRAYLAVGDLAGCRPRARGRGGIPPGPCARARAARPRLPACPPVRRGARRLRRGAPPRPDDARLEVGYLNTAIVSAVRCFHRGRLVDAARLFSEVLDRRGSSMLPHVYLARIFRELGKDAMALFHLDAACGLSPGDPSLQLQRAMVLLALGREKEALEALKVGSYFLKAGEDAGRSPAEVQRFLAVQLFQRGRFRDAIFHATRLLRADGQRSDAARARRGGVPGARRARKARNHYLRALEGDREALAPRYGLCAVLWEQGRYGDLAAEARRVLRRDPADPTARYFESLALSRSLPPIRHPRGAPGSGQARGADPVVMTALAGVLRVGRTRRPRRGLVRPDAEGRSRATSRRCAGWAGSTRRPAASRTSGGCTGACSR